MQVSDPQQIRASVERCRRGRWLVVSWSLMNWRNSTPYDHHADNHNNYAQDQHNTGPSTTQHNASATTSATHPQAINDFNYNDQHQRSFNTQGSPTPYDKHCQLSFNDNRLSLEITPPMTIVCPRQPLHPPPITYPGVIRNYDATNKYDDYNQPHQRRNRQRPLHLHQDAYLQRPPTKNSSAQRVLCCFLTAGQDPTVVSGHALPRDSRGIRSCWGVN